VAQERRPLGPQAARGTVGLSQDPSIRRYYDQGREHARLSGGDGRLEFVRTQELVLRHLPPAPAAVLDVGGGAGIHAEWLARDGHRVHLVDPVPLHVEQATAAGQTAGFTAALGDARALEAADASFDGVLMLGPLYHLVEHGDRVAALREAARVVRPGGPVMAAAISRFASLFDGLKRGYVAEPAFLDTLRGTIRHGRHENPTGHPGWFTTAYFHRPEELRGEVEEAGLDLVELVAIEGPAGMFDHLEGRWEDEAWRSAALELVRAVEADPALLASGGHLLAVARRPVSAAAAG
jgi:ubiquinone/menaquinone biosynthesis C-methylase UbiE